MFNKTNIQLSPKTTVQFNSTSTGHIQKSHPKSKFIRFQKRSPMEANIFPSKPSEPYILNHNNQRQYITVLQLIIFGDDNYMCEYLLNTDIIQDDDKIK